MKNNQNKIILATGDVDQLESIDMVSNVKNYEEYINHCINCIFPYEIFLKENKRLKTDEDKLKLKNLKYDILKTNMSVIDIINIYKLKTTDKIITEDNIAYTNSKCNEVSKQVRKMLGKKNNYEIGEKLVCRKYFKHNGNNINKNFEYIIDDVQPECMILRDENTNETMKLKNKSIEDHFIHYYCNTCHSRQGSTIKKPITIHQWDFIHTSRKWLYTAITRATHFDNVYFMVKKIQPFQPVQPVKKELSDEEFQNRKINSYFENKIRRYIKQDYEAGRITRTEQLNKCGDGIECVYHYDKDNYVNVEWLRKCIGICCGGCGNNLTLDIDDDNFVSSDITAQRLDNTLPHYLDNIEPMCIKCNCSNK